MNRDDLIIYFDMDGVLANFEGYVKEQGIPYIPLGIKHRPSDAEMWARIKEIPHFYAKLPAIERTVQLFKELSEDYQCEILSAIPKPKWGLKNTGEDKIEWCHKYLDENAIVHIVYREQKKEFALGKHCILIDDLAKNIKEWNDLGGSGILYSDDISIDEIKNEIRKVIGG